MPQAQVFLHFGAPQVEKPVAQPQLVAYLGAPFRRKGQAGALVQHLEPRRAQLDIARFDFFVDRLGVAPAHDAGHGDDGFVAQLLGGVKILFRQGALIKDGLKHPFAIAQVDEDDAAHVAPRAHPAAGGDLAPDVLFRQGAAVSGSFQHNVLLSGERQE